MWWVLPEAGAPVMSVMWVLVLCCHLLLPVLSMRVLLHLRHEALRLLVSHHAPPWLVGIMWSTSVAWVVQPVFWIWQVWLSLSRICLRMRRHAPPYSGFLAMLGILVCQALVCCA